jgi:hypothetical protein
MALTVNLTYQGCNNCVTYVTRETSRCLW